MGLNNPRTEKVLLSAHRYERSVSPSAPRSTGLNNPRTAKTPLSAHRSSGLDKPKTVQTRVNDHCADVKNTQKPGTTLRQKLQHKDQPSTDHSMSLSAHRSNRSVSPSAHRSDRQSVKNVLVTLAHQLPYQQWKWLTHGAAVTDESEIDVVPNTPSPRRARKRDRSVHVASPVKRSQRDRRVSRHHGSQSHRSRECSADRSPRDRSPRNRSCGREPRRHRSMSRSPRRDYRRRGGSPRSPRRSSSPSRRLSPRRSWSPVPERKEKTG